MLAVQMLLLWEWKLTSGGKELGKTVIKRMLQNSCEGHSNKHQWVYFHDLSISMFIWLSYDYYKLLLQLLCFVKVDRFVTVFFNVEVAIIFIIIIFFFFFILQGTKYVIHLLVFFPTSCLIITVTL